MKKAAIILGLLLCSCAATGKAKVTMMDEVTGVVTLNQMGVTFDNDKANRALFVAAAEAAQQRGFRYFVVSSPSREDTRISQYIRSQELSLLIILTNNPETTSKMPVWDSKSVLAAK